jgi:hypothetical protein
MFAWSQPQQQQQQQQHEQPEQQQQQQQQGPSMVRTGAVVLSLQGPVEMELLVAQVSALVAYIRLTAKLLMTTAHNQHVQQLHLCQLQLGPPPKARWL